MCMWLRAQTNWHRGGIANIKGDSWVLWLFQSCAAKSPQCCRADVVRGRWNISQLRNDQPGAQSFQSMGCCSESFLFPTRHTQDWHLRQTRACVQHSPAALLSPAAYLLHASPCGRISSSMSGSEAALCFTPFRTWKYLFLNLVVDNTWKGQDYAVHHPDPFEEHTWAHDAHLSLPSARHVWDHKNSSHGTGLLQDTGEAQLTWFTWDCVIAKLNFGPSDMPDVPAVGWRLA